MTSPPAHVHSPPDPKHCIHCGALLELRDVPHDEKPRHVCTNCGQISYVNPKVVAASLPERDGKVLLLRRGIEPRLGFWTYPAGFLEFGESAEEGAARETMEETLIDIEVGDLLGVYSRPNIGIVVVVFRATVRGGEPGAGHEALEVGWFGRDEIPWESLAFDKTEWAIRDWLRATREAD